MPLIWLEACMAARLSFMLRRVLSSMKPMVTQVSTREGITRLGA